MSPDGGAARQLTTNEGGDLLASWSPDSTEIAFESERDGVPDIWVMSMESGELRRLTTGAGRSAAWSPNGQWVAFQSDRSGQQRVWRVPAGGGQAEVVTEGFAVDPHWAPNSREIYFGSNRGGQSDLWVVSLDDHTERQVTDLSNRPGFLMTRGLTLDSRYLYFPWSVLQGDTWVMDVVRNEE